MSAEHKGNRLGELRRLAVAGSLAVAGLSTSGAVSAQTDRECSFPPNSEVAAFSNQEILPEHRLPLEAIPEFINLSANDSIAQLYERVLRNPAGYIEVFNPETTESYGLVDDGRRWIYFIYGKDTPETQNPFGDWSIQVVAEDTRNAVGRVTVSVDLVEGFELFDNCTMNGSYFDIDPINLGSHSNEIFNIPEELKSVNWVPVITANQQWIEKRYRFNPADEKTEFAQFIMPGNILSFEAPYPLPAERQTSVPPHVTYFQEDSHR